MLPRLQGVTGVRGVEGVDVRLTSVDGLGPALRVTDVCVGEVEVSVGEDWQEQGEDGQEGEGEGGHGAPGAPPNHLHKIIGQDQ